VIPISGAVLLPVPSDSTEPNLRALACLPKAAVRDTQLTMPEESTTPDLVALVYEWLDDMVARVTACSDPDEARAAAEHLAQERG
jgi:hypothetical protein